MAKKKSKQKQEQPAVQATPVVEAEETDAATGDASEADAGEDDEMELLQVDLGDQVKMKQVLDETAANAVLEHVEEDYTWDNWKLFVMTLACAFAMVAQFAPIPFPESRPVLGICGAMYFVLSGALQFITTFVDQDTILLTKKVGEGSESGGKKKTDNADMRKYGIRVRSNLPRFSEWYSVTLEFNMPKKASGKSTDQRGPPHVEKKWSVGQFFDKEGYFDEVGLVQEVEELYKRFEQGKYDSEDKKKTD